MDNFNKIVSFVLGLIVVIVFLAVITGRLNLKNRFSAKTSVVPTPTTMITYLSPTPVKTTISGIKTIPSTGSPTELLQLLITFATGGYFLRRTGRKN